MEEELRRNVEELEQFSKLAVGREIKMIQLKEEINELLGRLDQSEKYEIVK
jgi:ribosome assembly protein YihI (activator of Der GTPase)